MIELFHNDIIPGVDYMAAESSERKKISTLYILEILKRYTDDTYDSEGRPQHCLTQAQIGEKLYTDYGITLDRKAVSRALDDLYCSPEFCDKIVFDTVPRKVIKDGKAGDGEMKTNYRYVHDFDAGEIRMLINAVLFSHHLSERECKELIKKISILGGIDQRSRMQKHLFNLSLFSADRVANEAMLATLDVLDEAIDRGRQVSFFYNYYGKDKKLHPKQEDGEDKIYIVNPYRMVANNGRFYLRGNYDKYDNVTSFRIDKITGIMLLDTPAKPKKQVKGIDDSAKTEAEMLYMQPGRPERIVFRATDSENVISTVVDWLGKSVKFGESDGNTITCTVKANPDAMRFWAMQYSDFIEIVEPESLREEVRSSLRNTWRKYNNGKDTLIESDENIKKLIAEWKQICEDAKAEKVDVKRLGETVRKTHLMLLPIRGKAIEGQYAELILSLKEMRDTFVMPVVSAVRLVNLLITALIDEVERKKWFKETNIPDDTLIIHNRTREEGKVNITIDINNFEEGYLTLLHYTDINAEESRKMHAEIREKMKERHKEIMEQRRKEREDKKKREEK